MLFRYYFQGDNEILTVERANYMGLIVASSDEDAMQKLEEHLTSCDEFFLSADDVRKALKDANIQPFRRNEVIYDDIAT